jgi:hypothetical protein
VSLFVRLCDAVWTILRAFCRMPSSSSKSTPDACSLHIDGPIAQLVEQLAFNQWVAGSSPARLKTRTVIKQNGGREMKEMVTASNNFKVKNVLHQ